MNSDTCLLAKIFFKFHVGRAIQTGIYDNNLGYIYEK